MPYLVFTRTMLYVRKCYYAPRTSNVFSNTENTTIIFMDANLYLGAQQFLKLWHNQYSRSGFTHILLNINLTCVSSQFSKLFSPFPVLSSFLAVCPTSNSRKFDCTRIEWNAKPLSC